MRWQAIGCRAVLFLAILAIGQSGALLSTAYAQIGGGPGGGGPGGGGGGGNNNSDQPAVAGVVVDAQGVLRKQTFVDFGGRLTRQRMAASRAGLAPEVSRFSKLRMVSLNRLEKAIIARNAVPTDEMRYLAGLLRVKYVFYYPETHDIVIAGPAEGWFTNPVGRVVGLKSGRPVVQLHDMVVALRAFGPDGRGTPVIGCSIDPTQEGLAQMQNFLRATGSYATPADTAYIVNGLRTSLGMQTVSINGVSPKTRFAQILVEADYRMKLIGIGLERPPVRMVSFIDKASPSGVAANALMRWYFVPDYQCVRVSADGLGMELVGDGVKLVGANEMVAAGGERRTASRGNLASRAFVASFTRVYSELADRSPVYAELRNLIDMAVASAYIQQQELYYKSDWKMELFGDEQAFSVELYNAPKQVESTVAAIWKGRRLMTPIGGGVRIQAEMALDYDNLLEDEHDRVASLREESQLDLAEGQWWWDAE